MGLFTAASVRLAGREDRDGPRPPFSRSYGVMLPSSLAKVLPFTLAVFCRPTCVGLRYGRAASWLGAFLGGTGSTPSPVGRPTSSAVASGLARVDFPARTPYAPARTMSTAWRACTPPRPPVARNGDSTVQEFLPALHRLRPAASPYARLPLGGSSCPRNPWACGVPDSHRHFTLLIPAFALVRAPPTFPLELHRGGRRSPTTGALKAPIRGFGGGLEPRYILGAGPLDQ